MSASDKRRFLYAAGYLMGAAQLIKMRVPGIINPQAFASRAAAHVKKAGYVTISNQLVRLSRRDWRTVRWQEVWSLSQAIQDATLTSRPKQYHAFSAGVNFGWAYWTLEAIRRKKKASQKDVKDIIEWLTNAGKHFVAILPEKADQIEAIVNPTVGRFRVVQGNPNQLTSPIYQDYVDSTRGRLRRFLSG